jgi:hypothetical protein
VEEDVDDVSTAYRAAAAQTRAWLDAHFDAQGRSLLDAPGASEAPDPRHYYKAPYLLALAGLRVKGARVARYVFERLLDRQGNLVGPSGFGLDQRGYGMADLRRRRHRALRPGLDPGRTAERIAGRAVRRMGAAGRGRR